MPRNSKTMSLITAAYHDNALNLETAIKGTRRLLRRYRDFSWLHSCATTPLNPHITSSANARIGAGILSAFLCDTHTPMPSTLDADTSQFIISLMHHVLAQVGAYPSHGKTYHTILHQSYFAATTQSDETTADYLHLERSVYYSYKREAIAIYGLVLISALSLLEDDLRTTLKTQAVHP